MGNVCCFVWAGVGVLGVAMLLGGAPVLAQSGTDVELLNLGGDMGGHTPRGFRGQGNGVFVGDNLNSSFPNGDGVQAFITFDLGLFGGDTVERATLSSDFLSTNGRPFADLGRIRLERVRFERFSAALWDADVEADSGCALNISPDLSRASCDLTQTVQAALREGVDLLQFRLRFDLISDGDGQQDLALFFMWDSNANEGDVFTLTLR